MSDTARFGPAGSDESFAEAYKSMTDMPDFLAGLGLNAFEYQCGRGVNLNPDTAQALREKGEAGDIEFSLHSPYYISLSGTDEGKRLHSIDYIQQSAEAVTLLGGRRIVIHSGSASKISRSAAVELALDTLKRAQAKLDELGYSQVIICPETMGKINQLGTVEEVCKLCGADERMLPCVDFGHVNSATNGSLKTQGDFAALLDIIENSLGYERLKRIHVHFSKIEFTQAGGEVRHLTFADTTYGPEFEPLAEEIARRKLTPFIICESAGTQARDAAQMLKILQAKEAK